MIFLLILVLGIHACTLNTPDTFSDENSASVTPTKSLTPELNTETPTPENCYWNWTYGEGSSEFDAAVQEQFNARNIQGTVKSSSYGEVYSCDQSYSPMSLDVDVEIRVASIEDHSLLMDLAEQVYLLLQEKQSISNIPGMGNVNLTFITEDDNSVCLWDHSTNNCHQ